MNKTKTGRPEAADPADALLQELRARKKNNRLCVTCTNPAAMKVIRDLLTKMIADPARYRDASIVALYEVVKRLVPDYTWERSTFRRHLVEDEPMWMEWLKRRGGQK